MPAFLLRLWTEIIVEPLRKLEGDNRAFLASAKARQADWKVMVVLVTTALSLTLLAYVGERPADWVVRHVAELNIGVFEITIPDALSDSRHGSLYGLACWACGCFLFYFALPALVVRLLFRERLRDYGISLRGAFSHWWLYVVMLLFMGPIIWLASLQTSFQRTYPFFRPDAGEPLWPRFYCWEVMYGVQFFALEFFFRGFMVHGLKHRFGVYGIFAMVVPYCMIHFGKPMPETLAAIVAGICLGYVSLMTRSIWLGTALHISVALSMDLTALYRHGYFS
jgi:membrane protease YdiL (CAAX protease family)